MQTEETKVGGRYEVAQRRAQKGPSEWFVVDRTGCLAPRRLGLGARALREAIWLTRVLNAG